MRCSLAGIADVRSAVRTLLDFFAAIPDSGEVQTEVLRDNIEWAQREKRIFLKQSLETRLIALCVSPSLHRRMGSPR
jgi:26S proteasome regulatory subunit N6